MPEADHELRDLIDRCLSESLPSSRLPGAEALNDAIRFALFPGGKRFRPVLTLLSARAVGGSIAKALPAACAIECLHTSSLIIDDLPSMDDAQMRRGNPALHIVFGENLALLAALALLNHAYALFSRWPVLLAEALQIIGVNGMIGGQAVDVGTFANPATVSLGARNRKTSALMRLTMVAGAIAAEAPQDKIQALAFAGDAMGEAYQMLDDLCDVYVGTAEAGKTAHQDLRHGRPSHALGCEHERCYAQARHLVNAAVSKIERSMGDAPAAGELLRRIETLFSSSLSPGLAVA